MYLARDRLIKKQLEVNKASLFYTASHTAENSRPNNQSKYNRSYQEKSQEISYMKPQIVSNQKLNELQALAHEQLSLQKVISREIDYHRMELFLILANNERSSNFYLKVSQNLKQIFNNQKTKKVFDEKWTHSLKSNVMGLFNRIVQDYYKSDSGNLRQNFNNLYSQIIIKLMKEEKLSRIEQKFIDPFLTRTMRQEDISLQVLGYNNKMEIYKFTSLLHKNLNLKQTPKTLSNAQYLQYAVFSLLGFALPHQKYLYNQLLHAPNPKFLFPFRKKGTFLTLTNQILLKSNKVDMIGFKYWNYYQYQESDVYQKVRKASQWQSKFLPMAIMLRKKVKKGLQRLINLIDQKVRYYNNRVIQEDGINLLNSYVQLCLQICNNHSQAAINLQQKLNINLSKVNNEVMRNNLSKINSQDCYVDYRNSPNIYPMCPNYNEMKFKLSKMQMQKYSRMDDQFGTILERVDIGTAFQSQNRAFIKQSKLKSFTIKLTQLYFILLASCRKNNLRSKFILNFSSSIQRLIVAHQDQKFTTQLTNLTIKFISLLSFQEIQLFIYSILERLNQQWQNDQSLKVNNEVAKIDKHVLEFISCIIDKYGFFDENDPTKKIMKLQFFYILALNFNQNQYFQSKKRLAKASLTININLSNNSIFDTLQTKRLTQQKFRLHLKQIFGDYQLEKRQHQGILAIIDQVITYRIQVSKDLPSARSLQQGCFYSVIINFLQQAQRLDPTGKLLQVVKKYFQKCKKTYMIEVNQMKFKDQTKKRARSLITEDVSFLVQASISANPIIAQFSQSVLSQYIEMVSELALYTRILIVFAECITVLFRKSSIEYQSKAQILKGKNLTSSILIPTNNKTILKRLIKIMIALYKIVLKGHCIDDNYLRVKVGYLIKQFSKSAKTPFGWKYLKYLLNNFKQDRQFISKQILTNNSCSWFINEAYFSTKINQMKPQKLLLDKYLLPLHKGDADSSQIKKLITNVDLQEETQFLIVPAKGTQASFASIMQDLEQCCQKLQDMYLSYQEDSYYNEPAKSKLQDQQNKFYDIISRIKMIYISKLTQIEIFAQIFQVCKKYTNAQLLRYILIKIVPFIYCINQFNERILILISEVLYYVVLQLNKTTKFVYTDIKRNNNGNGDQYNTFDLLLNCFDGIGQYQKKQQNPHYEGIINKMFNKSSKILNHEKSYKYMIIRFYSMRLSNLKKMFRELQKFLSDHMHVCIGKGFSLTLIVQIFSINFILEDYVLQFLHLQSICYCLTSQLELVNVLKSSLQKGQNSFQQKSLVQDFQLQTLKLGLIHFQRKHNFYKEELLNQSHNIKSLKTKIDFFIQICDYLRNEDFHQLVKKKLPKRNQKIFGKKQKNQNLFTQITDDVYLKKSSLMRVHERTSLASQQGQNFQLRNSRHTIKEQNQNVDNDTYDPQTLRYSLLYLISEQIDRTKAFSFSELSQIINPYSLAKKKKFISSQMILSLYNQLKGEKDQSACNILIYNFLTIFGSRIDNPDQIRKILAKKITEKPDHGFPQFLPIFIQQNKQNKNKIKEINFWKSPNVQILFKYLSKDYQQYPYLQLYVTKVLSRLHSDQILFYLPQIYQSLTLKTGKIIYNFLLEYARKSCSFAHQLIWIAKVQSKQQKDPHNKNPRLPGVDQNLQRLQKISKKLVKDIVRQFTRQQKTFFRQVNDFYQEVTAISGKMLPTMAKDLKKDTIKTEVDKIKIPQSAYLPINPIYKIVDIDRESGTPMQSAAKCPFLLTFRCKKYEGPDKNFQNRKKLKKSLQYRELQNQWDINQQQIPNKLPMTSFIAKASRMNTQENRNQTQHVNFKSQESFSLSRVSNISPQYMKEQISINDIKMEFSQTQKLKENSNTFQFNMNKMKQNKQNRNKDKSSRANVYGIQSIQQSNPIAQISCIFKVFDDIRQDCLALQIIRLFMEIFQRHNLQLKLFPYKTISNRTGTGLDIGGIIQVVPKAVSRDSIGKTNEQSLYQFFIANFGQQYNIRFQQARQNFIKSQAAYSIISYILQIKDRHNGNILINSEEGYLVHIDFGFIFDISPANNLKFQKADFKLTEEMIKIMGGNLQSEPFQLYLNLVIKGFLISRKYHQHIVAIIKQMYNSGLPCFLQKSIQNLKSRFVLQMSQIQAAQYMKEIVYKAADNWFTNWYDKIQWIQQKIYH